MGIVNLITRMLSSITRFMISPFGGAKSALFRLTTPFRSISSSIRTARRFRLKRYFRIPAPLRQLRASFRTFAARFPVFQKIPLFKRKEADKGKDIPDFDAPAFDLKQRHADYSQIHLINISHGNRTIGHIGSNTGRTETEFTIQGNTRIWFLRVNEEVYGAPLLMLAESETPIYVDDDELIPDGKDSLAVSPKSIIKIHGLDWRVELFKWDYIPEVTRVKAAWKTSIGPLHNHNEDAIGIYQHEEGYFFGISDGVGSSVSGEIASEFAIQYMLSAIAENLEYGFDWHDVLRDAASVINQTMRKKTQVSGLVSSATLTAVVIQNWDAFVIHIGDSRLYHLGRDGLHQVTRDHLTMVEQPGLNPGEVILHPMLNRALGKDDYVKPDLLLLRVHPGDRFLVVSDGVNNVSNEDLANVVRNAPIERIPNLLGAMAYDQGGNDNVSIIAIEVLDRRAKYDTWQAVSSPRVYVDATDQLAFDVDDEIMTVHPHTTRRRFSTVLLFAILLTLAFRWFNPLSNNDAAVMEATAGPTKNYVVTLVPTTTSIPVITVTPLPSTTPLPPTSTLRPEPTSTLSGSEP